MCLMMNRICLKNSVAQRLVTLLLSSILVYIGRNILQDGKGRVISIYTLTSSRTKSGEGDIGLGMISH